MTNDPGRRGHVAAGVRCLLVVLVIATIGWFGVLASEWNRGGFNREPEVLYVAALIVSCGC